MKPWFLFITAILLTGCSGMPVFELGEISGKKIFYSKAKGGCSNCHKTSNEKLVGPGLAGISKLHSREWIKKWVANPVEIWNSDHPETMEMKERLHVIEKPIPGMKDILELSEEEINAVVDFVMEL